jgi:hypothetical protein
MFTVDSQFGHVTFELEKRDMGCGLSVSELLEPFPRGMTLVQLAGMESGI